MNKHYDSRSISEWQATVHALAREKGWWTPYTEDGNIRELLPDEVLSKLMLTVSELAEAAEESCKASFDRVKTYFVLDHVRVAYDEWPKHLETRPKPEGFGVELADAVIRLMDTCSAMGVDLELCVRELYAWNTRMHPAGSWPVSLGDWQRRVGQGLGAEDARELVSLGVIFARLMSTVMSLAKAVEEVRRPGFDPRSIYFFIGDVRFPYVEWSSHSETRPKPEGFGVELASVVFAIWELCELVDADLESCVREKHEFNRTREIRHGKRV